MAITTFSDRYYSDEMDAASWNGALEAVRALNDIKFRLYDALYANGMEPFVRGILRRGESNSGSSAVWVRLAPDVEETGDIPTLF